LEVDPRWHETFFDRDWLAIAVGQDDEHNRAGLPSLSTG